MSLELEANEYSKSLSPIKIKTATKKEREERLTLLITVTLKEESDFFIERSFLITGDLEEIFKIVPIEEDATEKIRRASKHAVPEAVTGTESSDFSAAA